MQTADRYTWRPFRWAIALAIIEIAGIQSLRFQPLPRNTFGAFLLDSFPMFLVLLANAFALCFFAIGHLISLSIAFFEAHPRRAASLACALVAIPLVFVLAVRVTFLDPFYWHAVLNRTRFERAAAAVTPPGQPLFAVVNSRFGAIGFAINPIVFESIVFDEADELAREPDERSAEWVARNDAKLSNIDGAHVRYAANHLFGHFYHVTTVIQ